MIIYNYWTPWIDLIKNSAPCTALPTLPCLIVVTALHLWPAKCWQEQELHAVQCHQGGLGGKDKLYCKFVRGDWGENSYQVSIARLVYRKSKPLCVLSAGKIRMLLCLTPTKLVQSPPFTVSPTHVLRLLARSPSHFSESTMTRLHWNNPRSLWNKFGR